MSENEICENGISGEVISDKDMPDEAITNDEVSNEVDENSETSIEALCNKGSRLFPLKLVYHMYFVTRARASNHSGEVDMNTATTMRLDTFSERFSVDVGINDMTEILETNILATSESPGQLMEVLKERVNEHIDIVVLIFGLAGYRTVLQPWLKTLRACEGNPSTGPQTTQPTTATDMKLGLLDLPAETLWMIVQEHLMRLDEMHAEPEWHWAMTRHRRRTLFLKQLRELPTLQAKFERRRCSCREVMYLCPWSELGQV